MTEKQAKRSKRQKRADKAAGIATGHLKASNKLLDDEYDPEYIAAHRDVMAADGMLVRQFMVKWRGYPADQATWEPEDNMYHLDIYSEYVQKYGLKEDNLATTKVVCFNFYKKHTSKKGLFKNPQSLLHLTFELEENEKNIRNVIDENIKIKLHGVAGEDRVQSMEFWDTKADKETKRIEVYFRVKWEPRSEGYIELTDSIVAHSTMMQKDPDTLFKFYESCVDFEKQQAEMITMMAKNNKLFSDDLEAEI